MRKFKQFAALSVAAITALSMVGCSSSQPAETTAAPAQGETTVAATEGESEAEAPEATGDGKVYYLNSKPEISEVWEDACAAFTEETGIPATVVTAAAGTYEQTLKSEVAKDEAPTLFIINGPVGYSTWKDYTLDLKDTELYASSTVQDMAVVDGEGVYGVPYALEGYGIIANKRIINDYIALGDAKIADISEINSFAKLKEVAEDIQGKKDDLGIFGAFASTSFSPGEDWRWQTHLANLPLYYEYKDKGVTDAETLEGTYLDNFKNIFDLYINNSITEPGLLATATVETSMAEFALEEVAFVQNGDWGWGQIVSNNEDLPAEDVTFLPIYIGAEGEENQGLCVGTEAFWAMNSQVSEADQEATKQFINWLLTSDTGKDFVINQMNLTAPFSTFGEGEVPANPLAQAILQYAKDGKESVDWAFVTMPSQEFKDNLGAALLEYAQGTGDWDMVVSAYLDGWASEKASPTPAS